MKLKRSQQFHTKKKRLCYEGNANFSLNRQENVIIEVVNHEEEILTTVGLRPNGLKLQIPKSVWSHTTMHDGEEPKTSVTATGTWPAAHS